MDDAMKTCLKFLGLSHMLENWDEILAEAKRKQPSYHGFLTNLIEKEFVCRSEKARSARLTRAKIPKVWVMETFPFDRQPKLRKKLVMELYDSMQFITEKQNLVFIGPTGCGKTGLATAFLIHAINQGYRGYFIEFKDLTEQLLKAKADYSEHKLLQKLAVYDILLIDEVGHSFPEREQAEQFFHLMKSRDGRRATILSSQLGFEEWGSFLPNKHITDALLDRLTVNCTVFNMKECISIRLKKIVYAAEK